MARKNVIIQWSMSSFFGWGVYGLNIALQWASDPDLSPVFGQPVPQQNVVVDALRQRVLEPVIQASNHCAATLASSAGETMLTSNMVLQSLGNGFFAAPCAHNVRLSGTPTVAIVFLENTALDAAARESARRYALIVAGSTWNQKMLEGYGLGTVPMVLQGVDPTVFHPAPRTGLYADRFLVFSGGKLEHRKGQDLTLLAFKAFAERHPEALLVTAWHSPWADLARDVTSTNSRVAPVPFDTTGRLDLNAWAAANGIEPGRLIDLGFVPNMLMPSILREMDVALFPNRSEGGTNLVAMECMACGVPTILSANTGHLDLIAPGRCIALTRQAAVPSPSRGYGTEGWGESDVEEIVEALEGVWRDRQAAAAIGRAGAEFMAALTWPEQIRRLKETILPYLPG